MQTVHPGTWKTVLRLGSVQEYCFEVVYMPSRQLHTLAKSSATAVSLRNVPKVAGIEFNPSTTHGHMGVAS